MRVAEEGAHYSFQPSPLPTWLLSASVFITVALQTNSEGKKILGYVRFQNLTAVYMKSCVFWNVTLCGSCKNQCFGGTYCFYHQGENNQRARNVSSN
jgi:hypothetical protein